MTSPLSLIRVLVVDDHPRVRRGICDLLECYPDILVVGTAEDGPGALAAAKRLSPDVILLDVGLPGYNGIEVARKLRRPIPPVRIIFLTGFEIDSIAPMMDGIADGLLLKTAAARLPQAIRTVYRGERWISPSPENK